MKNKIESIVIVNGELGSVATLRFANRKDDRILSSSGNTPSNKETLYKHVIEYVKRVTR